MQDDPNKISEFAIASLVVGIISFISLAGIEKAIVAIVFGALALKKIQEDNSLSGKKLAKAAIIISIFSLIITINFLIRFYPKFQQLIREIQSENSSLVTEGQNQTGAYEFEGIPDTRQF